ncbi:MAG: NACHT domain-containing protein, partial [Armatimonadia bacterium]|nr:NACHT domain-containing protein [Armatimonadia bacterium]
MGFEAMQETDYSTRDSNHITILYQGRRVVIPSLGAVAAHRAALRGRLARDARARWGGMSVYIQGEGAALPIEASPYQQGRLGPRANLMQMLHAAERLLVLGEPGVGKTIALERFAWELCQREASTVPVLIRLFHYSGDSLLVWVRATLQATGKLHFDDESALADFLSVSETRCVFLFDGLNEVPPDYCDRLVGELVRWMDTYPQHAVVLTSRVQDEMWRLLRDKVSQAVVVQPISDAQVLAYLESHLGQRGTMLYERLDGRIRAMARNPLL